MSSAHEKSFAILTAALGNAVGVPDAVPGADGVFRMEAGERPVSIIPQGEAMVLYTSLGDLPEDEERAMTICRSLLGANVLYRGTYGGSLGVMEEGTISFCFQTPMHSVTEEGFVSLVENFITIADLWAERVAGMIAALPEYQAGASAETPDKPPFLNDPLMRA